MTHFFNTHQPNSDCICDACWDRKIAQFKTKADELELSLRRLDNLSKKWRLYDKSVSH